MQPFERGEKAAAGVTKGSAAAVNATHTLRRITLHAVRRKAVTQRVAAVVELYKPGAHASASRCRRDDLGITFA